MRIFEIFATLIQTFLWKEKEIPLQWDSWYNMKHHYSTCSTAIWMNFFLYHDVLYNRGLTICGYDEIMLEFKSTHCNFDKTPWYCAKPCFLYEREVQILSKFRYRNVAFCFCFVISVIFDRLYFTRFSVSASRSKDFVASVHKPLYAK